MSAMNKLMKKILILLCVLVATNLMAQRDTVYFDKHWQKTSKDSAVFYRPIPLKKVGNLFQVKDYYSNGNLQMEGFWSDVENEVFHGKSIWYYENGKISEEEEMVYDTLHGGSIHYTRDGFLRAKGAYKKGKYWSGTFMDRCCSNGGTTEFDKGIKKASYRYYKGTNQIAEKSIYNHDKAVTSMVFYDRKGEMMGAVSIEFYMEQVDGKMIWFYADDDGITAMSGYVHYKNKKKEGEDVSFDVLGNIIAKGTNINGEPYSGTHISPNGHLYTYVDGKFEGEEVAYSEKGRIIAKGINRDGAPWQGHFNEWNKTISNYKNGQLVGKQVVYHTNNFEKIASYYFISKGKKEGESAAFDKEGKKIAQGIYKNNAAWQGTFYDDYYKKMSSYKEGKKHGMFINYTTTGRILSQQEYVNGKIGGLVKSTGYFEDRICACQYENGKPYDGEVCQDESVVRYENGVVVKRTEFGGEKLDKLKSIREYDHEALTKKTVYYGGQVYELIYKDRKPYLGVTYEPYYRELTTYVNGHKNGKFSVYKPYSAIFIEGNFKDDLWEGKINFTDELHGAKTSCIYREGVTMSGTAMLKDKTTTYAKGVKDGLETSKKPLYYNYKVVYDSLVRNYRKGKLEGDITYFKAGKAIASGIYMADKPFHGTFYIGKNYKNTYENGELTTTIYQLTAIKLESSYIHNLIVKEKLTIGSNEIAAVGKFKRGLPFEGRFTTFDDKTAPTTITYTNYKKGKRHGTLEVFKLSDKRITRKKEYKKDILQKESWLISFKGQKEVIGNYKEGKPFSGYFYSKDDIIEVLSQYRSGIKYGYTYYAVTGSKMENVLDSISYVNGKPFEGGELEQYKGQTHQHIYVKGKHIKTNIYYWGLAEVPDMKISFVDDGFITYKISGEDGVRKTWENVVWKKYNQVTYTNVAKSEGEIVFYENEEEAGFIKFANGFFVEADYSFRRFSMGFKLLVEKSNTLVVEIIGENEFMKFYPEIELSQKPSYKDLISFDRSFIESDGTIFFYIQGKELSNCSMVFKDGKPYHGIAIRNNKGVYSYEAYEQGEKIEDEEGLTKDELLKKINGL